MFVADAQYRIRYRTAQFYSTWMLMKEWGQWTDASEHLFPAVSSVLDEKGRPLVSSYALRRPDGRWAMLLVNKDPEHASDLMVQFHGAAGSPVRAFMGKASIITFGPDQFQWHPQPVGGYPDPDQPPKTTSITAGPATVYHVPRASIVVIRGFIG